MDQEMPVMDGLKCTKTIREWEKKGLLVSHVPVIGVTANARVEQIQALLLAGMVRFTLFFHVLCFGVVLSLCEQDDVVSKPFRIPEIVPKIEELATQHAGSSSSQSSSVSTPGEQRTSGRQSSSSATPRKNTRESASVSPGPTILSGPSR
jgi:CheY-like chemotaxis protein